MQLRCVWNHCFQLCNTNSRWHSETVYKCHQQLMPVLHNVGGTGRWLHSAAYAVNSCWHRAYFFANNRNCDHQLCCKLHVYTHVVWPRAYRLWYASSSSTADFPILYTVWCSAGTWQLQWRKWSTNTLLLSQLADGMLSAGIKLYKQPAIQVNTPVLIPHRSVVGRAPHTAAECPLGQGLRLNLINVAAKYK